MSGSKAHRGELYTATAFDLLSYYGRRSDLSFILPLYAIIAFI